MSPGYLPFKNALDLPAFFCENCGFWQRHFAEPTACPLCNDARHVLPQAAWRFHTREAAVSLYPCHWREVESGVWRFFNDPVSGIGSSGYLIQTPDGNLAFEGLRGLQRRGPRTDRETRGRPGTVGVPPPLVWCDLAVAGPLRSRTRASSGRPRMVRRALRQLAFRRETGADSRVGTVPHGRPFRRPHGSLRSSPAHPVLRRCTEVRTRRQGRTPRRSPFRLTRLLSGASR